METVAHHQLPALFVPLGGQIGQVRVNLSLQRGAKHPPRAFPHNVIQQRDTLHTLATACHYSQHWACFPDRRANVGLARNL